MLRRTRSTPSVVDRLLFFATIGLVCHPAAAADFAVDLQVQAGAAAILHEVQTPALDPEDRVWLTEQLGAEPTSVFPTKHGFNSAEAWIVELDGRRYFYKHLAHVAEEGPDRGIAEVIAANQEAYALGFGPEVVAADANRGVLLLAFVAGEVGSRDPDAVARFRLPLLRTLRQFHAATASGTQVASDAAGHHASCATLQVQALLVTGVDVAGVVAAAEACHTWTTRLDELPRPTTRVHNDLNPRNFICSNGTVHLLDWDTLGWGDPLHDLALYALEHKLDIEKLPGLLVDYQGDADGLLRLELYLARMHARRFLTLTRGMPWDSPAERAANLAYIGDQLAQDAVVLAR